jgi:hypothetical protein
MPIALQLMAAPFRESRLLAVGHALEQALGDPVRTWGIDIESSRPEGRSRFGDDDLAERGAAEADRDSKTEAVPSDA